MRSYDIFFETAVCLFKSNNYPFVIRRTHNTGTLCAIVSEQSAEPSEISPQVWMTHQRLDRGCSVVTTKIIGTQQLQTGCRQTFLTPTFLSFLSLLRHPEDKTGLQSFLALALKSTDLCHGETVEWCAPLKTVRTACECRSRREVTSSGSGVVRRQRCFHASVKDNVFVSVFSRLSSSMWRQWDAHK